jgi:pre-mRNA-splicing factor CWC22
MTSRGETGISTPISKHNRSWGRPRSAPSTSTLRDAVARERHWEHKRTDRGEDSECSAASAATAREERSVLTSELYLPPFRVAELQRRYDESGGLSPIDFQRLSWEKLRKRINGIVNRANKSNAGDCVVELFNANIVRGMGMLCISIMRAQVVSQNFTPVYAGIVAAINARIPELGELLLSRVIAQLKRGMVESDRGVCIASVKFIAHLYNQSVVDSLLPLEVMGILAANPTNDSIELLVNLMKECGALVQETEPILADDLFGCLRRIVQEGEVDIRIQYLVEGLMSLRRKSFSGYPSIMPQLDLVPDEDRIVHSIVFSDQHDVQEGLSEFRFDGKWEEAELRYALFRVEVLGEDDNLMYLDCDEEDDADSSFEDADGNDRGSTIRQHSSAPRTVGMTGSDRVDKKEVMPSGRDKLENIKVDMTEEDLVSFRRKVYLRIMSSATYEECAHKLTQFMRGHKGKEAELCHMILECCSQERSFLRYYGLLGQQFCFLDKRYVERFEEAFTTHYATIHRFDLHKIRNMGSFYAFLLCADALPWSIFAIVHLTEEETTSSSRIFLSYLFKEIANTLTVSKLCDRFRDERLAPFVTGLFEGETVEAIRFSINFFTSIGLGPLTDDMRDRLRARR